jgi:hypothetical protein
MTPPIVYEVTIPRSQRTSKTTALVYSKAHLPLGFRQYLKLHGERRAPTARRALGRPPTE